MLLSVFTLVIVSCEDNSINSVITSFEKFPIESDTAPMVVPEDEETYTFSFSLDERQITDTHLIVEVGSSSTATEGVDFQLETHDIDLAAFEGREGFGVDITVLEDYEIETEDEKIYLTFKSDAPSGLEVNETLVLTIQGNVVGADLPVELSWSSDYYDAHGNLIEGEDLAEVVMYLTEPDGTIIETIDEAGYKDFVLEGTLPDGEYLIKAKVVDYLNPGELGDAPVLSLAFGFSQLGKIPPTEFSFPEALSVLDCDWNVFTIASITKTGEDYEVTKLGETAFNLLNYAGDYNCDEPGYAVYPVNFTIKDCYTITNHNFWDGGFEIDYVLDPDALTVTIPLQTIDGSDFGLGDLDVEGSGTFDPETFKMVVDYTVKASGGGTVYDDNTHTFTK